MKGDITAKHCVGWSARSVTYIQIIQVCMFVLYTPEHRQADRRARGEQTNVAKC